MENNEKLVACQLNASFYLALTLFVMILDFFCRFIVEARPGDLLYFYLHSFFVLGAISAWGYGIWNLFCGLKYGMRSIFVKVAILFLIYLASGFLQINSLMSIIHRL